MDQFLTEIRKIPPVTRFICGSSLGVTGAVLVGAVAPYTMLFVKDFVFKKLQVCLFFILCVEFGLMVCQLWRLYTAFFLGGKY
jgi:Derlin-2/3